MSEHGVMSTLPERMLVTIENVPDFLERFNGLIRQIDHEPTQILIEAKILEIALNSEDSFGIAGSDLFTFGGDGDGIIGTQGLEAAGAAGSIGLFLNLTNPPEVEILFNALEARCRVRTLSTPKLLALENQDAWVRREYPGCAACPASGDTSAMKKGPKSIPRPSSSSRPGSWKTWWKSWMRPGTRRPSKRPRNTSARRMRSSR